MVNALLFPGQGSQSVEMGKELYETLTAAKELLDEACEILGYDLKGIMFEGPIEKLTDTKYAQAAIYVCSSMYLEKAKQSGIIYDYVAGHSLGEYTALYAADVFSFKEGLKLVDKRGRAMAEENDKGIMAVVLGLEEKELQIVVDSVSDVVIANLNTKKQIVISGKERGIDSIAEKLSSNELVTVKKLPVSAAFHSPQMAKAAEIMKTEIEKAEFREPKCYVVSNVTGIPAKDAATIKANLMAQITGQVRWYASIITMKEAGVEAFFECGNGKVLRKMNKAITLYPKCLSV